ncbi:MAG: hypothetical protein PHD82_02635 [Candidatus Riflebacteria bacterium]|nr:hypothetical protein [Candidatus Riflebacteria bacterium]
MKNLTLLFAMMVVMALFTGCASTGSDSAEVAYTPPDEEISAIEASLLVDRTLAASVISSAEDASIRADTAELSGSKRYRNRNYQVEGAAGGMALRRGDGSCQVEVTAEGLRIGLEQCVVEKAADGSIKITRGNGSVIQTPVPDSTGVPASLSVDGIEWQITFGETVDSPLATMKNTKSGMILTVTELDDGSLTIVRDSSEVYSGRWASDGDLEFTDGQGQRRRYRYGRNK